MPDGNIEGNIYLDFKTKENEKNTIDVPNGLSLFRFL